ncbi:MAG: Antibiotic biosynthesis monooxygenase [Firmicutes bacterium]|nr:Antibiotic biosynthesis monooxygenase [Bacillota bacterium]
MLVVIATLTVKSGKKAELFAFAQDLITATRAEQGCISYVLLDNPYDAGVCVFLEEWADKQALERHLTTSHIREWRQKSAELLTGKIDVKLYQGDETKL